MRMQEVRYPIIGITLILFVLAGCGVSAEPPTASPSAMPTEPRTTPSPEPTDVVVTEVVISEYCTNIIIVNVEAYVDQNENGTWDPAEAPLEGVGFWTSNQIDRREVVDRATSDAKGQGEIHVRGSCDDAITIHAETPPGYQLTTPGLSGANLSSANLVEADLRGANLNEASLRKADLTKANLSDASLLGADLTGAHLFWPNLRGTQIDDATLMGAKWRLVWDIVNHGGSGRDLSSGDLSNANLSGADLRGADLREADASNADLSGADLRTAKLDEANLSGRRQPKRG